VAFRKATSPEDIWSYASRTLTQTKFPFWSAIITQQHGKVTIAAGSWKDVFIQPPSGETWWVEIAFSGDNNSITYLRYYDYPPGEMHCSVGSSSYEYWKCIVVSRILTNSLYALLRYSNLSSSNTYYGRYGYSGFKLSQPLWSPKRLDPAPPKPLKLKTDLPLPDPIKALDKYKALILGLDPTRPGEYALGIILEEDTPLAIDPATGFPVERKSAYVKADVLADMILKFKSGAIDYVKAGYETYLRKWKVEGIDFGIL